MSCTDEKDPRLIVEKNVLRLGKARMHQHADYSLSSNSKRWLKDLLMFQAIQNIVCWILCEQLR
jgi:hypothetical protein